MIAEIRPAWLDPENAGRPVTISYSTQPRANTSVRGSAARPSSRSGAMDGTVPISEPVRSAAAPRSSSRRRVGRRDRAHDLGQAEVHQLDTLPREDDVARLEIAVDYPEPVSLV